MMKTGDLFMVNYWCYVMPDKDLNTPNANGDIINIAIGFNIMIEPSMFLCGPELNLILDEKKRTKPAPVEPETTGIILNGDINNHPNFKKAYRKFKKYTLNAMIDEVEEYYLVMIDNKIGIMAQKFCEPIKQNCEQNDG